MIPMPAGFVIYNGSNEPCDMAEGPCSCGATHSIEDWEKRAKADDICKDLVYTLKDPFGPVAHDKHCPTHSKRNGHYCNEFDGLWVCEDCDAFASCTCFGKGKGEPCQ